MGADAPRRTVSSNTAAKLLLILATLCIPRTRPGFVSRRVISRLRSGAIWYQLIWVCYESERRGSRPSGRADRQVAQRRSPVAGLASATEEMPIRIHPKGWILIYSGAPDRTTTTAA